MHEVGRKNTYFLFAASDLEAASDYSPYLRLMSALHSANLRRETRKVNFPRAHVTARAPPLQSRPRGPTSLGSATVNKPPQWISGQGRFVYQMILRSQASIRRAYGPTS